MNICRGRPCCCTVAHLRTVCVCCVTLLEGESLTGILTGRMPVRASFQVPGLNVRASFCSVPIVWEALPVVGVVVACSSWPVSTSLRVTHTGRCWPRGDGAARQSVGAGALATLGPALSGLSTVTNAQRAHERVSARSCWTCSDVTLLKQHCVTPRTACSLSVALFALKGAMAHHQPGTMWSPCVLTPTQRSLGL